MRLERFSAEAEIREPGTGGGWLVALAASRL
jgi:hypothetical protein